jgi:aminocarboxymuconate-semialdehyde decarboxylase
MSSDLKKLFCSVKVIDTHAHVVLRETEGAAGKYGPEILFDGDIPIYRIGDYSLRDVNYLGTAFTDPKIRLDKMDEAKIDVQILTPNPLTYFHYIEASKAISFSRIHNNSLAKMIQFAPERLLGMANLPIQDPIAARDEIYRCVEELNLCGASIGTSSIRQLDDPCYDILYEAFELLGVPLFIHPAPSGIDRPLIEESLRKYELDLMVGFSFQETIAVSNLIFGGVLERHPKLHVCISHGGGMLPFVAGRLSKASRKRSWVPMNLRADGAFEEEIRKLWYDSHVHSNHSLNLLEKIVGNDRIVFGTNFAGWDQPETYETNERSEQWRLNTLALFSPN